MGEFKTIPAYPDYECDVLGNVRRKGREAFLSWQDNGKGYKMVKLYNETKKQGRMCLVHRVVMSTWRPDGGEGKDVNHKDGDKANNALSNLEWVSKSENTRHAHANGLFKSRSKLTIDDVKSIKELLKAGVPEKELSEHYRVQRSIINKIKNRKLYGYV